MRVRHYRGVTDIGRAARRRRRRTAREALAAAAKGFGEDAVPFDAYLDGPGGCARSRHRFSYANQGQTVAGRVDDAAVRVRRRGRRRAAAAR